MLAYLVSSNISNSLILNINRLAGLFRHHLANDLSRAAAASTAAALAVNGSLNGRLEDGGEMHGNTHGGKMVTSNGLNQPQAVPSSTTNSGENALDYTNRCYTNQQPKVEPQLEVSGSEPYGTFILKC